MKINWFNSKTRDGMVSFYPSHMTLNAIAKQPFEKVEYVRIGVDEENRLCLAPVTRDDYDNPLTEKSECYPIVTHASYARVSSTPLLKQIAEAFGMRFTSTPTHGKATYLEEEGVLLVTMEKGE